LRYPLGCVASPAPYRASGLVLWGLRRNRPPPPWGFRAMPNQDYGRRHLGGVCQSVVRREMRCGNSWSAFLERQLPPTTCRESLKPSARMSPCCSAAFVVAFDQARFRAANSVAPTLRHATCGAHRDHFFYLATCPRAAPGRCDRRRQLSHEDHIQL